MNRKKAEEKHIEYQNLLNTLIESVVEKYRTNDEEIKNFYTRKGVPYDLGNAY